MIMTLNPGLAWNESSSKVLLRGHRPMKIAGK